MSLIGELPLAAVELSCKDVDGSKRFYKDVVGLKPIEEEYGSGRHKEESSKNVHFDLGNIRLTLSQMAVSKVGDGGKSYGSSF